MIFALHEDDHDINRFWWSKKHKNDKIGTHFLGNFHFSIKALFQHILTITNMDWKYQPFH